MEIRIRDGDDWIEVFVDGLLFGSGHSLHPHSWRELLVKAGATVIEEEGNFCDVCSNWYEGGERCCTEEEE